MHPLSVAQAKTYISLGNSYQGQGDLDKASECYHRSLKLAKKAGDPASQARALDCIGECVKECE